MSERRRDEEPLGGWGLPIVGTVIAIGVIVALGLLGLIVIDVVKWIGGVVFGVKT